MAANVPKNETPSESSGPSAQSVDLDAKRKAVLAQLASARARSEEAPTTPVSAPPEPREAGLFSKLRKEFAEEWEGLVSTRSGKNFVVGSAAATVFLTGALTGAVLMDAYDVKECKKKALAEKRAREKTAKISYDESGRAVLPAAISEDVPREADSFAGVDLSYPKGPSPEPPSAPVGEPVAKTVRDRPGEVTVSSPEGVKALSEAIKAFSEQDSAPPARSGKANRG